MDEYTRLKEILESYLEKPDIELTEEEISAYHLYRIVDDKLEELRRINFDQKIVKNINRGLSIRRIGRVLDKENSVTFLRCRSLSTQCNGTISRLEFHFLPPNRDSVWGSKYLDIRKDVGKDEIYFGTKTVDKKFVAKYFDEISEMFDVLEEFTELYQGGVGNVGKSAKQTFSDGFFNVKFEYDTYGRTDISISIQEGNDPENLYNRDWFQRQKLSDYVKEHQEEILRKIPVSMNELNYTSGTIVKNSTSKMNVPVLVKKK